ncbi:MAG: hypothetical protein ACOH1R_09675 [Luteimonas sp.]
MRKVFTSARLENAEQVVKMLEDAGIQTRVINGRSYKGSIRGNFTYRDDARGPMPSVWIVRSEDQPRARAMLREAGLMDSSRNAPDSYLAMSFRGTNPDPRGDRDPQRRAFRIKLGLLVVIAAVVVLAFISMPRSSTQTPATPSSQVAHANATAPTPADLPGRGTQATPDSLVVALLRGELPSRADSIACIAVDGGDPSPALLASLPPVPGRVLPVSQCPAHAAANAPVAQIIAIGKYMANDAGTGTIFLQRRRVGGRAVPQWYDVRRDGDGWRVIQPL